ncbi:glutathione S-transferase family protein [Rhizobium sp. CB3171]|uniref:glutathione S-transferase family protein n=1 Tax=unclassified Rhizobium TaxID=2613769 RepID=UPI000CDF31F7|nr:MULTISPECIES: glutathione S-transferase family protein [Rhizobium]AVA21832.1 glutathione S-transferase protein [Rhizobium sp. NXC24]MDK4737758.1 glutathione S-transferase family protein [Rhizobium sp. CNPSo 3464]UWU22884.1 glutathione S-transferase family protein [Rhizobium tropici]WFU03671.1 glutathione S-transferase family protein [Rhizobium sp. CB3171]
MSLILYQHPLASFCHKVLMALYENGTPFESRVIDLGNEESRASLLRLWPIGKFPVLRDEALDSTVPETSIIIEYLDRHYPGATPLLPLDPTDALCVRLWDRFFDLYVQEPMQAIVADIRRPEDERNPKAVAQAQALLRTAYGMIEQQLGEKLWIAGDALTMADCAAAPALFYAETLVPFGEQQVRLQQYYQRLLDRPSFARVLEEAMPYFHFYPYSQKLPARFRPERSDG